MIITKKKIVASAMALSMLTGALGPVGGQAIVGSAATTSSSSSYFSTSQPNDVTGFKQSKSGTTSITLSWNKIDESNVDGYIIKKYDPTTKKWTSVTVGKSKTSYTFTKLNKNTVYKFVIRAYNSINGSKPSSDKSFKSKNGTQTVGMTGFAKNTAKVTYNHYQAKAKTGVKKINKGNVTITVPVANESVASVTRYKVTIVPVNKNGKAVDSKKTSQVVTRSKMTKSGKNLISSINVSDFMVSNYNKINVTIEPQVVFSLKAITTKDENGNTVKRSAVNGSVSGGTCTYNNVTPTLKYIS